MRNALVTGSSGLIGSEVVVHLSSLGFRVHGVDNNMRALFFGPRGDPRPNLERVRGTVRTYEHHDLDVRDRTGIADLVRECRPGAIIHCAAQPSHDLSRDLPLETFDVNVAGTLNLLEASRRHCPEAPFVFMSTNKVYGDAPNEIPLVELETRLDYARPQDRDGIDECLRIDRSTHSPFGASKAAADLLVQEYGRYFGLPTVCFRLGCVTGPHHAGVELHGFLSHLTRTILAGRTYVVFGYGGKQVRDQIHAIDVARACEAFIRSPSAGEAYNLGGGRANSVSVIEAASLVGSIAGVEPSLRFQDRPRLGDHACYITRLDKFVERFHPWSVTRPLDSIVREIVEAHAGERSIP